MVRNSKLRFLIVWTLIVLFTDTIPAKRRRPADTYDAAIEKLENLISGASSDTNAGDEKDEERASDKDEQERPEGRSFAGAKLAARQLATGADKKVTPAHDRGSNSFVAKKLAGRSLGKSKGRSSRVTEKVSSFGIYG